jgi:hypothetical protein
LTFVMQARQAAGGLYDYMLDSPTAAAPTAFYLHLAERRMDDHQLLPALEVRLRTAHMKLI